MIPPKHDEPSRHLLLDDGDEPYLIERWQAERAWRRAMQHEQETLAPKNI